MRTAREATNVLVIVVLLLAATNAAHAQQPTAAQSGAIRQNCRADFQANCAGVAPGGAAALACLKHNAAKVSPGCQQALAAVGGGAAAAAPASSASNPVASTGVEAWPHIYAGNAGIATVYQPQVISWPDFKTLNTRVAISIQPNNAAKPVVGTIDVAFATEVDSNDRSVVLTDAKLAASRFPAADPAQAAQIDERVRATLAGLGPKRVPLATLTLSLRGQGEKPPAVALNNDPPRIFSSARPASLVVFDGEPVLAPVTGTPLSFAVNTNWDVFVYATTKTWYLLNNGAWFAAPEAKGPWMPAGRLPPSFSALPGDANFADVKKSLPGRAIPPKEAPTIIVSTTPAAIIVTSGPPQFVAVPHTSLQYVANSDAPVFRDTANGTLYFLVSGRWFSAPGIDGPWTFATDRLPADFARIPADGPRGFVLVSVPGTPQAQEALLEAQIPRQATLDRANAKLTVVYSGTPQFVPIAGTPLAYATNTSFNVIQAGASYYACYQGAWFTAVAPAGPWSLAASVPAEIYAIPPSNPLYPCTYVKVYAATPASVTYGYTSGYAMGYVSAGVIVYGTGYYYPPYIYPAPIPIYYPYPYSYSGATYYNPATGAWAHGGAIYGPYGGVAKAGTAYNPATGAWASGGAIYGPNGGAGAFSAYNPTTGSYAHGSAVYGPDGAAGNASWYNARTGVSGSTQQNSNAYGRWGSSTISGPNQTVHTQSQSNAQGSAGSFSSSSGAKGAGVSGAGGNSAGVVKGAGGNVYAGADGNVYKKTDSGWEKYNDGSWSQVQKPASTSSQQNLSGATRSSAAAASDARTANQGNLSGATASRAAQAGGARPQGSAPGFEGMSQLENDREARTAGAQRYQQAGAMQGGAYAGRGAAAGRAGGFRR